MSGQLVIVLVPSASSVAAISFSTLFLAPPTATSPDNRFPPVTTNRSLTRLSVNSAVRPVSVLGQSARVRFDHGSPPDPHLHPDRRRRDHRVERFQPGLQERSAARGVRRLRRDQRRDRRCRRLGQPRRADARRCCGRFRTISSTRAPTCPPRWSRIPSTRRCGSPRPTSTGWSRGATSSTSRCLR